ncbi:hypothetical protein K2173_028290 [Erythroxylum novogranatense]|uniref:Endonuclease/exonuclease/phosphatase domain-containing protein n=1 Tax=Erythroxylum novogranatense TaxID=1862640 RepID=A0AAV8U1P7_9ROSI|nr:hypothetical protein K2173_028290 [Erythroxylum novogranatense]
MRTGSHRSPSPEHPDSAGKNKRNHFLDASGQNPREFHKKRRNLNLAFETETSPLAPLTNPPSLRISNRFQQIQSSCSRKRHAKDHHSRRSSSSKCKRKWVFSSNDACAYKDKLVVVSYNILGVENASKHQDLYYRVPPKYLEWNRRKKLICEELAHYNAGILCFQEVDRFSDLNVLLRKDGFRGVYKARTGEACDGCAIFWKENLFTLLHEETIEFQRFGLRNNVAQLCVLQMSESQLGLELHNQELKPTSNHSRSLVIGNIHVLFNPNRGDIKLGQVQLFLKNAYKLSQQWGNIPVIIGGDLNSLPQSAVYQFLASSELDILQYDRRNISGKLNYSLHSKDKNFSSDYNSTSGMLLHRWSNEEIRLASGSEGITQLQHQLKLSSAYLGVPGSHRSRDSCGEPLATSYHSKFLGTVDYIWHTRELVPVRVLETLPVDVLRRSVGLPSEIWGSDHLALACELAFIDDGNQK